MNNNKTNTMTIQVNTKSNFKNCNGQTLQVVRFDGYTIVAKVPRYGYDNNGQPQGEWVSADFCIKEIVKINS